jgi:hypothetical protein
MAVLVGPCMLVAPLVAVVAILCIPLWPVAIVVVGMAWLVVWPLEQLARRAGSVAVAGWSARVAKAFVTVLKPWNYFDPPNAG